LKRLPPKSAARLGVHGERWLNTMQRQVGYGTQKAPPNDAPAHVVLTAFPRCDPFAMGRYHQV
ncbi:MAG: hypothetical protein MUQ10_11240, partial [Anaerolineae bacterium]|nr:hypothetical protein [Anaerolineae bacterium]